MTRRSLPILASLITPAVLVCITLRITLLRPAASPLERTVESFCPGGSHPEPAVVLCDDFEDGAFQTRWDIGGHNGVWPLSQFVRCTDNAFGFRDRCAAWSNGLVFDNDWGFYGYDARRAFPPQSEFYEIVISQHPIGPLDKKGAPLAPTNLRIIR